MLHDAAVIDDERVHDDLERHEGADEEGEEEAVRPLHVPQRQRVAGDDESAIDRIRLGTRIQSELKKPTLTPPQLHARSRPRPGVVPGVEVQAAGSEKISPRRISSIDFSEVTTIT